MYLKKANTSRSILGIGLLYSMHIEFLQKIVLCPTTLLPNLDTVDICRQSPKQH